MLNNLFGWGAEEQGCDFSRLRVICNVSEKSYPITLQTHFFYYQLEITLLSTGQHCRQLMQGAVCAAL